MSGWRLFSAKLRTRPLAALGDLVVDYLTYVAMVVFFVLLWALYWPLTLLERVVGHGVRGALIRVIARLAHG